MLIIGDIHGKTMEYLQLIKRYPEETSVQLGDFGWGFLSPTATPKFPENAWFIRGNHDSPQAARSSKNYLGDYGITEIDGWKVFYLSGAWSIDYAYRIVGRSWWPDEQLSEIELEAAKELYVREKPEIVLTHDGPEQISRPLIQARGGMIHKPYLPTRTSDALTQMFTAHQPKRWLFGHWHFSFEKIVEDTHFTCLPELGYDILPKKGQG